MAAVLAICSSLVFGVADFLGGMSARRIAPMHTALVSNLAGLAALGVGVALSGGSPAARDLALGAAAGLVGAGALSTFYLALSRGAMSVVAPISAVSAAIVPVLVGLALGEAPGVVQWAGIVLALPAIALISREGTDDPDEVDLEPLEERATPASNRFGVITGLVAGVGFGAFVVLVTRTSSESGYWPLVTSRTVASTVLALAVTAPLLAARRRHEPAAAQGPSGGGTPDTRAGWQLGILAGLLDGSSNMLILEAGRRGMLVLVGVIGALYPASTIVLARVVLGERLQRHQLAGLGLAVLAVTLIALP